VLSAVLLPFGLWSLFCCFLSSFVFCVSVFSFFPLLDSLLFIYARPHLHKVTSAMHCTCCMHALVLLRSVAPSAIISFCNCALQETRQRQDAKKPL
jgi:hypothetical protein